MTDINTAPEVHVAGIVRTRNNGDEYASSIDVTHSGALIVDQYGNVKLIPWHNINEVWFNDQPGDDGLPKGHEGSE